MAQLEIRIRHEDDTEAVPLAEVPFKPDAIDSIIETIARWGINANEQDYDRSQLSGQFIKDASGAYFEVFVGSM